MSGAAAWIPEEPLPPAPLPGRRHAIGDWRAALAITLAALLVRLIVAAVLPLFPDEAYYWQWSRHLAWGYFDHPPGIALMIRAGTALFGNTPFAVRLFATLGGFAGALLLLGIARRLAGDRAALYTALILACMPLAAGGLLLATPDAPLLLADSLLLYAVIRALSEPLHSTAALLWWLCAGAALGMSFDSKYTAALLPLGMLAAFLVRSELRQRLLEAGPWIAGIIAFLVTIPVLYWNAQHGWVSFRFQLVHGLGAPSGSPLLRELSLLGGQAALASPILFGVLIVACVLALGARRDARVLLLGAAALTPFLFFAITALRKPVEVNWPAPAYLPGVVALAIVGGAWRRWLGAALALGGVLVVAIYIDAFTPVLPVQTERSPVARSFGWDALAARAATARDSLARRSGQNVWMAANRYQEASELAFNLPEHPPVFSLNLSSRRNQYDLWPRFPRLAACGDGLIVVIGEEQGTPAAIAMLAPHFDSVQRGRLVRLEREGATAGVRRIWELAGWRGGWPRRIAALDCGPDPGPAVPAPPASRGD